MKFARRSQASLALRTRDNKFSLVKGAAGALSAGALFSVRCTAVSYRPGTCAACRGPAAAAHRRAASDRTGLPQERGFGVLAATAAARTSRKNPGGTGTPIPRGERSTLTKPPAIPGRIPLKTSA